MKDNKNKSRFLSVYIQHLTVFGYIALCLLVIAALSWVFHEFILPYIAHIMSPILAAAYAYFLELHMSFKFIIGGVVVVLILPLISAVMELSEPTT